MAVYASNLIITTWRKCVAVVQKELTDTELRENKVKLTLF